MTFRRSIILQKDLVLAGNLKLSLSLAADMSVQATVTLLEDANPSQLVKIQAELELLNNEVFNLVQYIQNKAGDKDVRTKALERIKQIDAGLAAQYDAVSALEKEDKKGLIACIHECAQSIKRVVQVLRQNMDLSHLSNHTIAQLNDEAYKAINKGGLANKLDKIALKNVESYKKLEEEQMDL